MRQPSFIGIRSGFTSAQRHQLSADVSGPILGRAAQEIPADTITTCAVPGRNGVKSIFSIAHPPSGT